MNVLGLEFSSSQRSVAVVRSEPKGGGFSEAETVETGGRAVHAFEMIESALRQSGLEREAVDCVAVGLGPGSYMGIRGAIAVAQGWELARGRPIRGVSSAESIALAAADRGIIGRVAVVIDAQRGELYLAEYDIRAGECRQVGPLRLARIEEARALQDAGYRMIGPEVTRWFPASRIVWPNAAFAARLALKTTGRPVPGDKLEPIYLRETSFLKAARPAQRQ